MTSTSAAASSSSSSSSGSTWPSSLAPPPASADEAAQRVRQLILFSSSPRFIGAGITCRQFTVSGRSYLAVPSADRLYLRSTGKTDSVHLCLPLASGRVVPCECEECQLVRTPPAPLYPPVQAPPVVLRSSRASAAPVKSSSSATAVVKSPATPGAPVAQPTTVTTSTTPTSSARNAYRSPIHLLASNPSVTHPPATPHKVLKRALADSMQSAALVTDSSDSVHAPTSARTPPPQPLSELSSDTLLPLCSCCDCPRGSNKCSVFFSKPECTNTLVGSAHLEERIDDTAVLSWKVHGFRVSTRLVRLEDRPCDSSLPYCVWCWRTMDAALRFFSVLVAGSSHEEDFQSYINDASTYSHAVHQRSLVDQLQITYVLFAARVPFGGAAPAACLTAFDCFGHNYDAYATNVIRTYVSSRSHSPQSICALIGTCGALWRQHNNNLSQLAKAYLVALSALEVSLTKAAAHGKSSTDVEEAALQLLLNAGLEVAFLDAIGVPSQRRQACSLLSKLFQGRGKPAQRGRVKNALRAPSVHVTSAPPVASRASSQPSSVSSSSSSSLASASSSATTTRTRKRAATATVDSTTATDTTVASLAAAAPALGATHADKRRAAVRSASPPRALHSTLSVKVCDGVQHVRVILEQLQQCNAVMLSVAWINHPIVLQALRGKCLVVNFNDDDINTNRTTNGDISPELLVPDTSTFKLQTSDGMWRNVDTGLYTGKHHSGGGYMHDKAIVFGDLYTNSHLLGVHPSLNPDDNASDDDMVPQNDPPVFHPRVALVGSFNLTQDGKRQSNISTLSLGDSFARDIATTIVGRVEHANRIGVDAVGSPASAALSIPVHNFSSAPAAAAAASSSGLPPPVLSSPYSVFAAPATLGTTAHSTSVSSTSSSSSTLASLASHFPTSNRP